MEHIVVDPRLVQGGIVQREANQEDSIQRMARKRSTERKRRPQVTIRHMEIDDLPKVFHLGEKLFTADAVPNLYRTWDSYEVASFYLSESEYCFVAEMEQSIVGFALGTTISKPRSAWKYAHLVWLGVHPDLQGTGVAEKLFEHFKQVMLEEGVRIMFVDSEADNVSALAFFEKMGFSNPREHIYLSLNLSEELKKASKER
ncbi:Ribosomal protein S18 acetylase RimI [Desulfacinum hydrothermale DSM 13146]|uniref:Ribosomal protein S18 acetylase RimI n=1 Tax=Desulfacinum hydrothermale DSM 13146 TaxID=1121390 RepID=A0A1W1XAQ3_9BACT|nr:GNAT family N-acetyltransferase [Desulfacinum hydrothermale]SMC20927.1 Ribosomal protein S18 acetylase RimI [Desulfacinum hydrothermale DSM 13146]